MRTHIISKQTYTINNQIINSNKQKERGADVNENLNSPQYDWEEIDGEKRVTRINWKNKKLCGDISFAGLSELRKLVCSSDGLTGLLTGLDVRENTKLESLFCGGNQLTELDISKNMELYDLDCEINQLTELDLNNNPKLEYLYCNRNQLAKLDLSKNIELKYLACARNQLTALDISKNIKLEYLYCSGKVKILN